MNVELPAMADNSTLEKIELRSEFEGSTSSINAKQLDLTLDQSKLTGQFAVNNFSKPGFNFNLKLDQIDLDRYLPPVEENEDKTSFTGYSGDGGSSALPLDTLRQINAKGKIDIGKMTASGLTSENIHVTINAENGL